MTSENELQMHNNIMNSCNHQNFSGSCSVYNKNYYVYEEDQQKYPQYNSVRESKEFFESRRNIK